MEITRVGSQPSSNGGPENFTGHVRRDPLFGGHAPSRMVGGLATFEAGARTVWHTHPVGQILIVTQGVGRIQAWGGSIEEIRCGDVVWFAPQEKHWHGAAPTTGVTHIALVEHENGETTTWLEPVSPDQYGG